MITDYEHLNIGAFQRITELAQGEDNDLAIVAVLSGKTEDELLALPLTEYAVLRDGASFLFTEPKPAKVRKTYTIAGREYELIADARRLNTAQYYDYQEWAKQDGDKTAEMLSVVLIPKGKQYGEGYDPFEVINDIRDNLSILDAMAIRNFFTERLRRSMLASLTSSERQSRRMKMIPTRMKIRRLIRLLRNGDGCVRLTALPNSRAVLGTRYIR